MRKTKEPIGWLIWMFVTTLVSYYMFNLVITISFFVAGILIALWSLIVHTIKDNPPDI
jgi:hypothetical protein